MHLIFRKDYSPPLVRHLDPTRGKELGFFILEILGRRYSRHGQTSAELAEVRHGRMLEGREREGRGRRMRSPQA
jgi:hypothetical protein